MKHTREEHLAMAAALREAIPYLWDGVGHSPRGLRGPAGQEEFVCNALIRVKENPNITIAVRGWVMKQIAPDSTFENWLANLQIEGYKEPKKLQATRLAWMHNMIEVLEKE